MRFLLLVSALSIGAFAQGFLPAPGTPGWAAADPIPGPASVSNPQGIPMGAVPNSRGCSLSYTTNLAGWWKADAGLTCTGGCSDGNAVTAVADQSGNSRNWAVITNAAVYYANQVNGLPAIRFNANPSDYSFTGIDVAGNSGVSVFVLYKQNNNSGHNALIAGNGGAFSIWLSCSDCGLGYTPRIGMIRPGAAWIGNSNSSSDTTTWHYSSLRFAQGVSWSIKTDGSSDGGSTTTQEVQSGSYYYTTKAGQYGGTQRLQADIAELLIFTGDIGSTNETTVNSYLSCRKGS